MAKVTKLPKQANRTKRKTFSLRGGGNTLMNSPSQWLCEQVAAQFFADQRSVSMVDNATGKTVQHWIYGRAQK